MSRVPSSLLVRLSPRHVPAAGWPFLVAAAGLVACETSAADRLAEAQARLSAGAYAEAAVIAGGALESAGADAALRWRLEIVRLEGLARAGDGAAAKAALQALSGGPNPLKPTHFVTTSEQLKAAGAASVAIEVLDLGAKKFPGDPLLDRAIAQAKTAGTDEELEALRSLGYLE